MTRRSWRRATVSLAMVVVSLLALQVEVPQLDAQSIGCAGRPATIVGTPGSDVLRGTPGPDVIVALGGADDVFGGGGADIICAGRGPDIVRGGAGDDVIYAGRGSDRIFGGAGDDTIFGGESRDTVQGNTGDDRVVGGPGGDVLMGGLGSDVVEGGLGPDRVVGGAGSDDLDGGHGTDVCSLDDHARRCERATAATRQAPRAPSTVERVIHVSIDGLRSDHVTEALMPSLSQLRAEGVSTLNARNDPERTNTLPNHTSQLTGLAVEGTPGHGVDYNSDLGGTVHDSAGRYVYSVYDVVHDRGLQTAAYVGKSKFAVHERSWNDQNGAADLIGTDDGRDKIDIYTKDHPSDLVGVFLEDLAFRPDLTYTFFHIRLPDSAGHDSTWGSAAYRNSVEESDAILDQIVQAVLTNAAWRSSTGIIVTSDHGGEFGGASHADESLQDNYTIPFVVWAPGVAPGADLYDLNRTNRRDPGLFQVGLTGVQPIRGHEAGNVALDLLGLPSIPGSVFNADFDLELR